MITDRILIVDDIPSNLDVLSQTLNNAGYDVAIATSGERALKQVRRKIPDLILLDIMMPKMDGFQVCKNLKNSPETKHIPIIFMTALTDIDNKIKSFALGGVDYITKPFQEEEVLARIKNHISLSKLTQNLEKEVAKQVESLKTAKKIAEKANEAKTLFLANMSHELRTPLNAILGLTDGLKEGVYGEITEKQKKTLSIIEKNGSHLLTLINDILDLTKIEAGEVKLNIMPTSVVSLCRNSLIFIQEEANKKKIKLRFKIPANPPDLLIDKERIHQVLINLLNNALKFTPEGGQITLEVYPNTIEIAQKKFVTIGIKDTGIGIAPENLNKLFQPFLQIEDQFNRKYKGTGLGLSLVKYLVKLHGGEVNLTSEVGIGSHFIIKLPCVSSSLPATTLDFLAGKKGATPLILFTQDNQASMMTISSYLEAKGYQIIFADNNQDVVNKINTQQPELIVIDLGIRGIQGLDLIKYIRNQENLVNLPIMVLGNVSDQKGDFLTAGATDFLTQPVKLKDLSLYLQQFLAQKKIT